MKFLVALFIISIHLPLYCQPVKMKLLGHWRDSLIPGSSAHNNAFNEAWGVWNKGREYGIIGSTLGTHFIDVTDPSHPKEVARVLGGTSNASVIHRDYDDYQCYLYAVCDEGDQSSLQIMDFSQLPDTVITVYDSKKLLIRSHNIFLDIPKGRLYSCAEKAENGYFALSIYDLKNPTKPILLGHFNQFGDIKASHVHDAYVRNDTAYLNCGNDGFAIMNFSDINDPVALFTLKPNEYKQSGYNHSGWLTPDGKTYVMADENHGSPVKILDLSDFSNIKVISTLPIENDNIAIPHNPLVSCQYAYVAYYYDGLQVYDISDPKHPIRSYYYPTSTEINDLRYKGAWGTYPYLPSGNIIVADMQNGMFVLEGIEKPCNELKSCASAVSNHHIQHIELAIIPNPAKEYIEISWDAASEVHSYQILKIDGSVLESSTTTQGTKRIKIDVSNYLPGLYLVRVVNTYGSSIHKIIIGN
ncbi:MAG: choice-of-anchor B family protein [Saprospiraceae bacterium]